MPAIPWRQNVANPLFPKMCSNCDCKSVLQVKGNLLLPTPHGKVSPFLRGHWAGR